MNHFKKIILSGLAALVMSSSSGCATLSYYGNVVENHLKILSHARNIEEVLKDASVDEKTKKKLRFVQEVRQYAVEKLHLPKSDAYASYVDFGPEKDHVVINVTACKELKFEAKEWCYPVIGCQEAKGFYDDEEAEAYAEELKKESWDVALSKVPAYSTGKWLNNSLLGKHFGDPVTNIMLKKGKRGVIRSIFHETAHQVVLTEDTTFNESFAHFVEEEGTRQYLKDHQPEFSKKDADSAESAERKRKDKKLFHDIVASYSGWLDLVYNSSLPKEKKLQKKKEIFQAMKDTYLREAAPLGASKRGWFDRELNNAHIIYLRHYDNYVGVFAALFEHAASRNWRDFYKIAKNLAEWPPARRKKYMERVPVE